MSATANTQETPTGVVKAGKRRGFLGRFDKGKWKQSIRKGREKGCSVFIAAEQLLEMGIDIDGPAPLYKVWASTDRPRAVISLKVPE